MIRGVADFLRNDDSARDRGHDASKLRVSIKRARPCDASADPGAGQRFRGKKRGSKNYWVAKVARRTQPCARQPHRQRRSGLANAGAHRAFMADPRWTSSRSTQPNYASYKREHRTEKAASASHIRQRSFENVLSAITRRRPSGRTALDFAHCRTTMVAYLAELDQSSTREINHDRKRPMTTSVFSITARIARAQDFDHGGLPLA